MNLRLMTLISDLAIAASIATFAFQRGRGMVPTEKQGGNVRLISQPMPTDDGVAAAYEIVLSGSDAPKQDATTPIAATQPLTDAATQALLQRLPAGPQRQVPTAPVLPPVSQPAPRPGQKIEMPFPAPKIDDPVPVAEAQAPTVVRVSPEGEVKQPQSLTVTFSEPMVPLTSHAVLAQQEVPVQLSPEIPGTWRWVGTQNLTFEPHEGFPAATHFTASLAADVRSQAGLTLGQAYVWEFETPRPEPIRFYPSHRPQELRPTIAIAFNQPVEADLMVGQLELKADGKRFTVRRLPQEEAFKVSDIRNQFRNTPDTHWFAFKPMFLLPPGTSVSLSVPKGVKGAQGPLPSREAHLFEFSTYGKLAIDQVDCYGRKNCGPGNTWNVVFTNPLDSEKFTKSWIEIEPQVAFEWRIQGQNLQIEPQSEANTRYQISFAAEIADRFGQTLGEPTTRVVEVGPAPDTFMLNVTNFALLDPRQEPNVHLLAAGYTSVDVTIRKVSLSDWPAYLEAKSNEMRNKQPQWPGKILSKERFELNDGDGKAVRMAIPLANYFKQGEMLLVEADPKGSAANMRERLGRAPRRSHIVWLQHTPISAHVIANPENLMVYVSDFGDGAPIAKADVSLVQLKSSRSLMQATADRQGLARFESLPKESGSLGVLVRSGEAQIFLPDNTHHIGSNSRWQQTRPGVTTTAFIVDDRGVYKPGERVHIKGWLRNVLPSQVAPELPNLSGGLEVMARGPRNNEIFQGTAQLDAFGAFDFAFDLPEDVNLGQAHVQIRWLPVEKGHNEQAMHFFQIAEFRTPDFEVAVDLPSGNLVMGGALQAQLRANFYSGEALTGAPVQWQVSTQETYYAPPNWGRFQFGKQWPWWCRMWFPEAENHVKANRAGQTDASGSAFLGIDLDGEQIQTPLQLRVEGSAQDLNRNTIAATAEAVLHPADYYVGLRASHQFGAAGQELEYEIAVTDIDGTWVSGEQVLFEIYPTKDVLGDAQDPNQKAVFSSQIRVGDGPMSLRFGLDETGSYRVQATVRDTKARTMRTTMPLWIGKITFDRGDRVNADQVIMIPDKQSYEPGETARITLQAPFQAGYGLVQIGRHDLQETQSIEIVAGTATISLPITAEHIPGVTLSSVVHGQKDGEPAYAYGDVTLDVSRDTYRIEMAIDSDEVAYAPGGEVEIQVATAGQTNLLLMVVDEAVLAMSNYTLSDPLETFLTAPYWPNDQTSAYELLVLQKPQLQAMSEGMLQEGVPQMMRLSKGMADDAGFAGEPEGAPIEMRKDFRPLAAYYASLATDAQGKATVRFNLPERLSRYRIMAVAASSDGQRFGTAERNIHTRLPLAVRPNLPRFLNFGDQVMLSFTVQNMTGADRELALAVAANGLTFLAGQGRQLTVPADGRVEVLLPVKASLPGVETVQVAISSGGFSDAVQVELPIYEPATTEAFATYGSFDDTGVRSQTLQVPLETFDQFGGLNVTTSATALHGLSDAVAYLRTYPHAFADPIASRVLTYVALGDVLPEFGAAWDRPAIQRQVVADLETLATLQRADGGFAIWRGAEESHPFISVHVAHALVVAEQAGQAVPKAVWQALQGYLNRLPKTMKQLNYGATTAFTVEAYRLLVKHKAGESVSQSAAKNLAMLPLADAPLDALAMILPFLPEADRARVWQHARNALQETAATANFTDNTSFAYRVFRSERRTDALMLRALVGLQEQPDLSSKLARGLLAHRQAGRWRTVQENVFVILALSDYFAAFEQTQPDFVADYWLADRHVAAHVFEKRQAQRQQTTMPMAWLTSQPSQTELVFAKQGPGRMYYRLGLNYAPRELELEASSHGFAVQRNYEAVDDAEDVKIAEDGTVHVKRGARVRVVLEMAVTGRRHHVALMDRLPAGLEIINGDLATAEQVDDLLAKRRPAPWWQSRWYSFQNLRDERAEAFSMMLGAGVYRYSYVARAINAGAFIVPPCKAEEMYAPETFGRTATARMVIED